MTVRRRCLMVTPELPSSGGNGLAMRAGTALRALAAEADVFVAVVPGDGRRDADLDRSLVERLTTDVIVHRPSPADPVVAAGHWLRDRSSHDVAAWAPLPHDARSADPGSVDRLVATIATQFGREPFDLVYAERLRSALWARPFLAGAAFSILDLDDDDATTYRRFAAAARRRELDDLADHFVSEAEASERLSTGVAGWFDALTVASPADVGPTRRHGNDLVVSVVNAVELPAEVDRPRPDAETVNLLAVANHTYLPNRWATEELIGRVAPRVAASIGRSVVVDLVGPGSEESRHEPGDHGHDPRVEVRRHGRVDDVEPFYRAATAAVICLDVGGGTRLKALEAFAHGVPVVSSTTGVEGLDVTDGDHLLIADGSAALAAATADVVRRPADARARAVRARALVADRYTVEHAREQLSACWR